MLSNREAIKAAGRPYAFTYHARLSGDLYGVLLWDKTEAGPDTRGLQRGNRHIITDADWEAWELDSHLGGQTRMMEFFMERYPPPVDPRDEPLTTPKAEAIEVVQHIIEAVVQQTEQVSP